MVIKASIYLSTMVLFLIMFLFSNCSQLGDLSGGASEIGNSSREADKIVDTTDNDSTDAKIKNILKENVSTH
jgi:hypothetical protein